MDNPPPNKMLDSLCKSDIIRKEDWFLLLPVKERLIKYTDLKNGNINFRDVVYLNEMLRLQNVIDDYLNQIQIVESKTKSKIGI